VLYALLRAGCYHSHGISFLQKVFAISFYDVIFLQDNMYITIQTNKMEYIC